MRSLLAACLVAMAILLGAAPGLAGILDATWNAPTTNVDGSPLTDLASYRVYFGTSNPPCPTSSFWQVSSTTAAPTPGTVVTFGLTGLVTGTTYFVQVTAVDTSGNESACSSFATGVARLDSGDTTPPTVTITSPTSNPTYTTSGSLLTLGGTASDNVGVTQVTWTNDRGGSGTASGTTTWSASGIGLQVGTNVLTVTARDAAGNSGAATLTVTFIDLTPPSLAITAPTSNPTYSTTTSSLSVGGTASDNVGVTQVTWMNDRGGSGTATGTTTWSVSGIALQAGTNVLTVAARDAAGNAATATLTVTYSPPDTTPPTVTITAPTSSPTYTTGSSALTLGGTASDNVGVTQVTWTNDRGGSGTATGTTTWSATGIALQPGTNVLTVTARDAAGNTGTATLTVTFADTTAPTVAITAPTSGATFSTNSNSLSLGGTAADNVGVTQVTWTNDRGGSGTATGTTSWSASSIALQPGTNVLTVTARDAAGNTGTATLTVTFTDTTPPTVTITAPTSSPTYSTGSSALALGGTAADNVGVTQVTWSNDRGGSGTATGTTSWSASGIALQPGTNVLTVTARDAAGNTATATLTVTYTDSTLPTLTITAPTSNPTYSTGSSSLSLGGTASDNVGVTQVTWTNDRGGSGTATGTTSWTVSGIVLQSGANVLTVTARDAAGNAATATLTVTYTDATPPIVSITSPTSTPTYSTTTSSLTLGGTASDNVGVTQVTWTNDRGGSGTATGTTSWTANGVALQPGTNVLTATARDAAGNTGTATMTVTFTDATPPTVAITSPTSNPTYSTGSSALTLGGTASDNVGVTQVTWSNDRGGSGTATGTTSWSASGIALQLGTNVLTVTARDAAGNAATATLTVTYSPPDTTPPTVAITAPTSNPTYSTTTSSLSVGGTAADNVGVTQVTWTNDRGGSGTATGTTSWTANGIALQPGTNVLTATARDAAGNSATASLTVTYTDTTSPTVTITAPTSIPTYSTGSSALTLGGTASDNVGVTQVTWSNDRGGSGTATGTTSWTASGIALQPGANVLTVTARDAAANSATATLTVTYTDATPPTVSITSPTSNPTYSTTTSSLTLGGTAADNVGVTQVTWTNDRGGSGTATGTTTWSASGIALQLGTNVLTITARDAAGNTATATLTVTFTDATPPTVAITAPTSSPTYSTGSSSLSLGGTAADNVGVTQLTWTNDRGGSGTATGMTSWSAAGIVLQLGANVLTVTARDAAGNTATASLTVTYADTTPPTVAITSPTSAATYSTTTNSLTLGGTAADNVGVTQVTWSNDRGGSGTATGTTSWSSTGIALQPGTNVLTVTARDAAGNAATATLTVTYSPPDTTPPTVAITSPTSAATYSTTTSSLTLGGTASDNVGVTQVTWTNDRGGSGTATGTTSWTATGIALQPGTNVLIATARDAAGNTATATLTVTFTDATPPTVSITSPTSTPTYSTGSSSLTLGGTAADNVGVTQVTWSNDRGGSGTATGTTSWSASGIALQLGTNVLTVTARDAAGNSATATLTVTYADSTPPTVTITSPTSSSAYSTSTSPLTLGGTAADNVGVTQVTWTNDRGGSGTASGTTTWSASGIALQPGTNVLTVTARDAAGNSATASLTVTFTDTTPPIVTITAPTSNPTYSTTTSSLSVGGTASDNVGVTQVTWSNDRGGSGTATGTTSWTASGIALQPGTNVLTVTARDAAGNTATASLTVTFTDTTPPTVAITAPTASPTYTTASSSLTLGGTAADNVGVTQVTWTNDRGGSGTATGTTSWSATGITLQPGTNVLTVTARDAAGNSATATLTVTADTTPPTVTITAPTSNLTYSTTTNSLTVGGTASDNVGVTQVTWGNDRGGSGTATGTTSWTASGIVLQPGTNVLTVTARDAAGNNATATLTVTFTDTTPPTVAITSPTSTPTYSTMTSSLTVGGTAADDVGVTQVTWTNDRGGSGTATGTTSWNASGIILQLGTNVLTVTARDAAGNSATATLTVAYAPPPLTLTSFTADKSAPQPPGTTITFTVTAAGGTAPYQYKWLVYDGATWGVVQNWSTSNTYVWAPGTPNASYQLGVWIRSADNSADSAEVIGTLPFAIQAAAGQGSGTLAVGGLVAMGQGTGGLPAGAQAAMGQGTAVQAGAGQGTLGQGIGDQAAPAAPLTLTSFTADKSAPQPPGTTITFTVTAAGGTAPYQYKWLVYDGATWSVMQNWSTSNTYVWTPRTPNASYQLGVWIRSADNSTDSAEVIGTLPFAIQETGGQGTGDQAAAGGAADLTSFTADKSL